MTNKTTEPAALAGIEPVPVALCIDAAEGNYECLAETPNDTLLYAAPDVERLVQERDANAAYFEAYHQLRVAVNAAYPQDPYQLAEDVPALMQQQLAAMTQERDWLNHKSKCLEMERASQERYLAASQAREQQLRGAMTAVNEYLIPRLANKVHSTGKNHILPILHKALSLPQDDTALRQWGAGFGGRRVGPFVEAIIDKQSGLHELWLLNKMPSGVVNIIAGPARWPEGWIGRYADAATDAAVAAALLKTPNDQAKGHEHSERPA